MAKLDPGNLSVNDMLQFVARYKSLRGSDEAYVDSRLPGHKRRKINIIGGPEAGKVDWLPSVLEQAEKSGLARDEKGELMVK